MITKETVFVVGAGTSKVFNYAIWRDLLDRVFMIRSRQTDNTNRFIEPSWASMSGMLRIRMRSLTQLHPSLVICRSEMLRDSRLVYGILRRMIVSFRDLFIGLICVTICAVPAQAHPHVWVTMHTELIYAPDGRITGVRHAWAFDDMFSVFATQGLETKEKGKFTREELAPLAKVNVESLKEFDYFTYATADGKKVPLSDPLPDYWLDYTDSILTLHFTLPFKKPIKAKELKVEIYDPTIFVDFEFAKKTPVKLVGAPQCRLDVALPPEMSASQSNALSQIPADAFNTTMAWGAQFANKILVHCP